MEKEWLEQQSKLLAKVQFLHEQDRVNVRCNRTWLVVFCIVIMSDTQLTS
jgi:hypothetical protein